MRGCCARCANWNAVKEKSPKLHCADDVPQYRGRGECRAKPPELGKDEYGVAIAVWPPARELDWCAAFVDREEAADGERNS